jgi:hypothetical protein
VFPCWVLKPSQNQEAAFRGQIHFLTEDNLALRAHVDRMRSEVEGYREALGSILKHAKNISITVPESFHSPEILDPPAASTHAPIPVQEEPIDEEFEDLLWQPGQPPASQGVVEGEEGKGQEGGTGRGPGGLSSPVSSSEGEDGDGTKEGGATNVTDMEDKLPDEKPKVRSLIIL